MVQTFSVLTVPANALCSTIHNGGKNPFRMPLIIKRGNEELWLSGSLKTNDVKQLMIPFEEGGRDAYLVGRDFLKRGSRDSGVVGREG